jgi:cytochrome c556
VTTLKNLLFSVIVGASLGTAGTATAFSFGDSSFNFGDDDWGWNNPFRGGPFGNNWNRSGYKPYVNQYDRGLMQQRRQAMMTDHSYAMDALADMFYGRYPFDQRKAIEYAREIEASSGRNLWKNFHPGSIAMSDSYVAPTFWGNEKAFQANAEALRKAAGDLADSLEALPSSSKSSDPKEAKAKRDEVIAKYRQMDSTCRACHGYFRR